MLLHCTQSWTCATIQQRGGTTLSHQGLCSGVLVSCCRDETCQQGQRGVPAEDQERLQQVPCCLRGAEQDLPLWVTSYEVKMMQPRCPHRK
jgi:hypothetical protein